jgi:V/A-type H+-transporting ATPase subunit I
LAESKIKELTEKQKTISKELSSITKKIRGDILTMHENALVAKEVLETLRKPGGTKNFAVIQGYIPKKMEKKFKEVTSQWTSITEEVKDKDTLAELPVYLDNPRWVKTFEVITNSQGIPKKGEFDPTWMVALMWPIFYGLMFADVGHGLLLMGLGLLFKFKGQGNLSRWGMLLAISGGAGALAGVFQGEVFGFHLEHFVGFEMLLHEGGPLHSISWLIGSISVAELTFDQVIMILKVSLFIGVIHLGWAFLLRIRNYAKKKDKNTLIFEAIPNLFMWLGVFGVMMGAIGSGYDVMNMYSKIHTEAVPWVSVLVGEWAVVWIVVRVSVILILACVVLMIIGGIKHNKKHPEDGGDMVSVIMEVLLGKTIECLAHSISYARIGIMLLVHAALLLTVNQAFESLGGLSSPMAMVLIIGGQIGIMMIEGLIVYIQSLRLHLYEFFTKWYDGGSQPFKQLVPETVYNSYSWKSKKK